MKVHRDLFRSPISSFESPFTGWMAPATVHHLAEGHEIEFRMAPLGACTVTIRHRLPFQRSTRVDNLVLSEDPTAMQFRGPEQDTSSRLADSLPPAGRGVDTLIHFFPFQRSLTGRSSAPTRCEPTARHMLVRAQEIPPRSAPAIFGIGSLLQDRPFHRSARRPDTERPIAWHDFVLVHETARSLLLAGLADLTICQRPLAHRSASARVTPLASACHPTATQAVPAGHDTPSSSALATSKREACAFGACPCGRTAAWAAVLLITVDTASATEQAATSTMRVSRTRLT
jgi:hypothetical protein